MAQAKYKCPYCGAEEVITFEAGKSPSAPKCKECQEKMKRVFGSISIGEVVSTDMIHIAQSMLNS